MNRRKNILLMSALALSVLMILTGAAYCRNAGNNGGDLGIFDTVATVNGEPITYGELRLELNAHKSSIYSYFHNNYGAADNTKFWTTEYDGETPIGKLKVQALDSAVRRKVQQSVGKKLGIVTDISYGKLLEDMKKENEQRQQIVKNKGVIYGPITYGEPQYAEQRQSNLITELKIRLKDELTLTDRDYANYYESRKDELYTLDDLTTVRAILIPLSNTEDRKGREEAVARLGAIKKRMDAGEAFDAIYEELVGQKEAAVTAVEKILGDYKTKEEFHEGQSWLQPLGGLRAGQVSDIVENTDRIGIYKIIDIRPRDYRPLEDVKESMKKALVDIKYEAYIDQLVKEAKVEVMEEKLKRVKMR